MRPEFLKLNNIFQLLTLYLIGNKNFIYYYFFNLIGLSYIIVFIKEKKNQIDPLNIKFTMCIFCLIEL